jgi:DNA modification methylase
VPTIEVLQGDCIDVLAELGEGSVNAVITDPPYGVDIMERSWDRFSPLAYQRWCEEWATACLRVLAPGGHLLSFGEM